MTDNGTTEQETKDATALELLPSLKEELGKTNECDGVDDEYLLMFLRWKPSVKRAADRYRGFLRWKQSNPGLFDDTLRISRDPELERLLQTEVVVGPPTLLTKQGGPLLIARLRNNDMTDGRTARATCRMLFYTVDRTLERHETQVHGVTLLHDLRGFNPTRNMRMEVLTTVFRSLFGHFPLRIKGIYLWQAPPAFHAMFGIMSNLIMPKKVRGRVHFIDDLSQADTIFDKESLLVELGGQLDWSAKDWVDDNKQREVDGSMKSLTEVDPKKSERK
jgi:hypothetical protein